MEVIVENKKGYKKTKLGWIPEDWNIKGLKEILEVGRLGGNYENAESNIGVPVIKMGNIGRGSIKLDKVQYLPENIEFFEDDILKEGDLLFNTRNTLELVGKVAIWRNELPFAVYNSNLMRMTFNKNIVSNYFMNYAFNSYYGLSQLRGIATGTTSVAAIYGKDLKSIKFLLPPIQELNVIVNCLSIWEESIKSLTNLIVQKELQNKGLMQQLLSGKKRLPGFIEKWNYLKFKEIYKSKKQKAGSTKFMPLSVTINGIVSQADYFNKEITSTDTSPYLVVERGDMVMSGLNFWMGSIDVLEEYEKGIVSPAYKVFQIKNPEIDHLFMRFFVRSQIFLRALIGCSVQGASVVRRNLDKETLEDWDFKLPNKREQLAIATVLKCSDNEINLLKLKLVLLKKQKNGLMQQLLTGKKRLNF